MPSARASPDLRALPRAPLPRAIAPMLCTLVDRPFDDPRWIFEPKFDGLRVLGTSDGRAVRLWSRNDKPQNAFFPEIAAALKAALPRPAAFDGEIVCLDENGLTSFRALQQRFHVADPREVARRAARHPAYLYLFDLLHFDGRDLAAAPLERRRAILEAAVTWSDTIRPTPGTPGRGADLFADACRRGGEGIIAKRLDSPYLGGRSADWVKIKCSLRQEFVIGGYTDPQRTRIGLGALLVGYYDDGELVYAGKVGTGYTDDTLRELKERLAKMEIDREPFDRNDPPRGQGVHWVKPELVAEIGFAEWTQNGRLRQPRYEGLRMDKKAASVRRERPRSAAAVEAKPPGRRAEGAPGRRLSKSAPLAAYENKRRFDETPEPRGAPKTRHKEPIFVVQRHDASRLHYDFRLEADGVLKSWAVPKEPSLDPAVKRLAVEVEDHPLDYANFEGEIPEGNYGAGTVEIWDRGTYSVPEKAGGSRDGLTAAMKRGRIEVDLKGKKLKGSFALVRMGGWKDSKKPNWLLIKIRDRFAQPGTGDTDDRKKSRPAPGKAAPASSRARINGAAKIKGKPKVVSRGTPERPDFSHTDKVMFPDAGLTKGDVLDYYERVSEWLLPHLKERPATLERLPDGLDGPRFWQKNTPEYYPKWIPRVTLPTETGKDVAYCLVNDLETLLYLVNQGTITFHTYLSRVGSLERPDFVLFDLDPGAAGFKGAVAVARALHRHLEDEDAESCIKTSGKTGLHVMVPWKAKGGYDEARDWALSIAQRVVEELPDLATVERLKNKREARVYVDVVQNALGHHAVAPYVLRAVPGATVSTPLDWDELKPTLDPGKFTPKTIFRRLEPKKGSGRGAGKGKRRECDPAGVLL